MKTIQDGLNANNAMAKAVDQIKQSGIQMASSIQSLIDASHSIGQVSRDLKEIALQTKILALNAGVEAAHAGERGATFAVVAEQIKEIAERCKKASENTSVLIQNSLNICKTAVTCGEGIENDIDSIVYHQFEITQTLSNLASQSPTGDTPASADTDAGQPDKIIFNPATMATGENDIDQQHRNLIDMINQLGDAVREGREREGLNPLLDFLTDYVIKHFSAEEKRMDERRCPAADANKQAHAKMLAAYTDWRKKYDTGNDPKGMVLELQKLLSKWLVTHVCGIDCSLRQTAAAKVTVPAAA
jgi:hemerythrin-like metal-binding protein